MEKVQCWRIDLAPEADQKVVSLGGDSGSLLGTPFQPTPPLLDHRLADMLGQGRSSFLVCIALIRVSHLEKWCTAWQWLLRQDVYEKPDSRGNQECNSLLYSVWRREPCLETFMIGRDRNLAAFFLFSINSVLYRFPKVENIPISVTISPVFCLYKFRVWLAGSPFNLDRIEFQTLVKPRVFGALAIRTPTTECHSTSRKKLVSPAKFSW